VRRMSGGQAITTVLASGQGISSKVPFVKGHPDFHLWTLPHDAYKLLYLLNKIPS